MSNLLGLSREQLRKFLPDHQSIRAFEQLLLNVGTDTPATIEQANNNANTAIAMAGAALAALAELATAVEEISSAPASEITYEQEDYSRVVYVGSLGMQNDDEVEITGGSITGVSIGATSISYSGQLTSTVATGTAPMVVSSTTKVANLNVDLLDGADWASPAAIGGTTPSSATFTNIATTGSGDSTFGSNSSTAKLLVNGSNSGTGGGTGVRVQNAGTTIISISNKSNIEGTAYDATPVIYANATIYVYQGMDINGDVKVIGKSGFNNTAPITKPSVTGSRAGNAALASLLTQLSNYGLITDSTTA